MTLDKACRFHLSVRTAAVLLSFVLSAAAQDALRSSGWIVIPAAEYQSLRAKAYPPEQGAEASPVQATLTRISYDLRINGDIAAGQASLTIDVIKNGWVSVPVPANLLVREAKLDGKPVSLVSGGKTPGGKSVVFSHQGRAVLLLDLVLPVTATAANESISLPPALAGITRASVQLPRQGVDMKIAGGFLAEKSASSAESRWVAYGRGNEPLTFTWWRKTDDHRISQPLRMRGSMTELIGLGEDSTSINAEVNAEVLQGAAKEIRIQLPDKVTVNQVAGAMVADWEMKSGELAVTFLEPVEKTARFILIGETRTPREGLIEIPLLRLLNVERETGGTAVEVLGAGEIKGQKSIGLESADATDLGELVSNRQSPSLVAFRFRSGDAKSSRSLSVTVARYSQEAVLMANVEEARYQVLMSDEGKTLIQASYAIRNNQRNFLKITLPPGAVVWSASLSGKPIRPGQAPDGSLLLPLEKARAGEDAPAFAAEFMYLCKGDTWDGSGKIKLALPILDLPVSRTGLQYFYPPLFKVTPEPGSFRAQDYREPISAALKKAPGPPNAQPPSTVTELPLINNNALDLVNVMGGVVKPNSEVFAKDTQALVDKYRNQSQEGKRAGILPIKLSFPSFGPSIFLVSELTAENQSPTIEFSYNEEKKGGAR
jgi:hypothetical protein